MKSFALLLVCHLNAQAFGFFNAWDSDAYNWAKIRVPANGGTVSAHSYNAATRLVIFTKTHDLRQRIARAGAYAGNTTNALVCPLINKYPGGSALGNTTDTFTAFVAADYSETTGLTGDGLTNFLGTGVASSAYCTATNIHQGVYVRRNKAEVGGIIGSTAAGGFVNYFLMGWIDGNCYMYYDDASSQISAADASPRTGFYLAVKNGQSSRTLYKNGSSILSSSTDVGTTPAIDGNSQFVHGINASGSLNSPTSRTLSYYTFGTAIPPTRQTFYYHGVQQYQSDMNRAIIP